MSFRRLLFALLAAAALCWAGPGHASTEPGGHAEPAAASGHAPEGDHAAEGGHEAAHHTYTDDDDGDGTPNWRDRDSEQFVVLKLAAHAFNLVLYIGILVYFVRQPAADAVRERALRIRKGITDAAKHRDEAREHHEEVEARLQKIEDEIAAMRAEAEQEARAEAERILERARAEADRVGEAAQRNIRDEVARARRELQRDAVALAIQLAEKALKDQVTEDDQKRLAHEFLHILHEGAPADA